MSTHAYTENPTQKKQELVKLLYKGPSGFYSKREILSIETQQICHIFGKAIERYARYTLSPEGWKNFITNNMHEFDVTERRHANYKLKEEQAFAFFEKIDTQHKDTDQKGIWISAKEDPSIQWYHSTDGKIRLMEIQSRKNPQQHLLFITLGHIPGTDIESILLLRSNKPFELEKNIQQLQAIEETRSIAVQAYKERHRHGFIEISAAALPIYQTALGKAWIESEINETEIEQIPDDIKQHAVSQMHDTIEFCFVNYCRTHLEHMVQLAPEKFPQLRPTHEYAKQLLQAVRQPQGTTAGYVLEPILEGYSKEIIAELRMDITAIETIFAASQAMLAKLNDPSTTVLPAKIVKDMIRSNMQRYNSMQKRISTIEEMPIPEKEKNKQKKMYLKVQTSLKNIITYLNKVLMTFIGNEEQNIPEGSIVIGEHLTDTMIHNYVRSGITGAVSLGSSTAAHASIIASSLQFPLAVGNPVSRETLRYIDRGDNLLICPFQGKLIINPSEKSIEHYKQKTLAAHELIGSFVPGVPLKVAEKTIHLEVNATTENLNHQNYSNRIGLFRKEFEISNLGYVPKSSEWQEIFKKLLGAFPGGITFRTLDEGRDKDPVADLPPYAKDQSLRQYISQNEEVIAAHLEYMNAIFSTAQSYPGVLIDIMYPMIETLEDLLFYNDFFRKMYRDFPGVQIREGAMIETAGAVAARQQIITNTDFVSIGSNDLTMALLGKKNRMETDTLDGLQPKVLYAISQVIQEANAANKPIKICGAMAGDPIIACILLSHGPVDLSMDKESIPLVHAAINYATKQGLFPKITQGIALLIQKIGYEQIDPETFASELYKNTLELFRDNKALFAILSQEEKDQSS